MNRSILLTLGIVLAIGCGRSEPAGSQSSSTPSSAVNAPPPPPPPTAATLPKMEQKKAAVGAGKKGRYDIVGPVVTPVASYFVMRERLAYDIQIPEAMKLFKALEDRVPKSHEEFMEKVIKANHINLPLLPEGHRYIYDPEQGVLMIEQPSPQ